MVGTTSKLVLAGLLGAVALSGCSRKEVPSLMNLRTTGPGPDEFSIVPSKPLVVPEDLATLPEPNAAGGNATDQHPLADAVAALGGNKSLANSTKINSGEQALLNAAGRFGVDGDVRAKLALEDENFRKRNFARPLERAANVNVYNRIYKQRALDAYAELERLRRLGITTPTAPPPADN